MHINLNIIAVFAYILSFSAFINNLNVKDKRNLIIFITFTIFSLALLYVSNDMILFIITLTIYMILSTIKAFTLNIKKYNKVTIAIIFCIFIVIILNITLAQPHLLSRMLNPDLELSYMQDRLNSSKMIGSSDNISELDTDYYYMNFSNYSFVYLIEKYGKVLGIAIVSLFTLLTIKVIFSYKAVKDEYGKFLIIGLGSFIFIQCLLNLFTILGIINIGVTTMPFITHDNVSIIVYMMSISLMMSVYGQKSFYKTDTVKCN